MVTAVDNEIGDVKTIVETTQRQLDIMKGVIGMWQSQKGRKPNENYRRHTLSDLKSSRLQSFAMRVARQGLSPQRINPNSHVVEEVLSGKSPSKKAGLPPMRNNLIVDDVNEEEEE